MNSTTMQEKNRTITLVTFRVGELLCAMDIVEVDEIKRAFNVTRVHRAPHYVRGVVNIRGQIVTVIDLKKRMNIDDYGPASHLAMVVVKKENEQIGLLVDAIEDTVIARECDIEKPPSNINETFGTFLTGIYKTPEALITILNRKTVVERDGNEEGLLLAESFDSRIAGDPKDRSQSDGLPAIRQSEERSSGSE